jgi:hypothetical protein
MKTYTQLITEIFGIKKKTETIPLPQKRFPASGEANDWMSQKVAHYARHKPESLHRLFDPTSGDYLPADVHTGSSWKDNHQEHYRSLKSQHKDAAKKAKESARKNSYLGSSAVGDREDY